MGKLLVGLLGLLFIAAALFAAPQDVQRIRHRTPSVTTLNNNLVAFWKLEEASGTRNDSVGTNHLTDNNTVTQAAGKVGNAANFVAANSESLSIADNAALSLTGSMTVAGWFYFDIVPGSFPGLVTKWGEAPLPSYALYFNGAAQRLQFAVSSDGTTQTDAVANNFGVPSTATWYFVVGYFDNDGDVVGISVNNGVVNTTAFTSTISDGAASLYIGSLSGSANYMDGRADAVGIWSRKLTAAEITWLYNGGAGREYPF